MEIANPQKQLNRFSIFTILYMTSFMLEMTESWKHVGITWFFVALISALVFSQITRLKFFIFLVCSTAYILFVVFPEVANHVNFILLVNISLIISILYSWKKSVIDDEDYINLILPFLRISLILVYFLAGFHKFNQDFFNPQITCAAGLLFGFFPLLTSRFLGIPSVLILGLSLGLLIKRLLGNPFKLLSRKVIFPILVLTTLAAALVAGLLLRTGGSVPYWLFAAVILPLAAVIVLWEILGGLLLLFPKFQASVLLFSWGMHASLAMIGFVDFGTLAFALLFTFIPDNYLQLLQQNSNVKIGSYSIKRIYFYFNVLLLCSFINGVHYVLDINLGDIKFFGGILLDFAAIVYMWPILKNLCSNNRLPWRGVPVWEKQTPGFFWPLILLIILFAFTPYFGLRTAGNFSMFSNLRTEGAVSNHFILGSNPLKLWGYQEDVVEVLEIDDEAAELGHKYRPLKNRQLPVVEFRKLIHKWTQADYTVPITFLHDGVTYSSQDIVNDPTWRTPKRNWEMYLMDFRFIPISEPNFCQW